LRLTDEKAVEDTPEWPAGLIGDGGVLVVVAIPVLCRGRIGLARTGLARTFVGGFDGFDITANGQ
jgi:hypothetical protein